MPTIKKCCTYGLNSPAINDCDQAITLSPNDAISFASRGFAYRHLGKEEKAIKDFKKAQALDPSAILKSLIAFSSFPRCL